METDKEDLLNNSRTSIKSKSEPPNIKKIIFFSILFILCICGFTILTYFLILQSLKIKDLTDQINNLNNQFDKQAILFNQNITHLNKSMNEEIKLLKNDTNDLKNEQLLIYNDINETKNELIQNSQKIENCSKDIKNNEESINRNFAEIQSLKNLESNLALLIDFKIRIKADFYIKEKQAHLCSHNHYDTDRIDDSRIKLCGHEEKTSGCIWTVRQNGTFFEFALSNSDYEMANWKIEIENDNAFCINKEKGSILILEAGSLYKYYKIKNKETGQYLFINSTNQRDDGSYYIDLTTNQDIATNFYFEIYNE